MKVMTVTNNLMPDLDKASEMIWNKAEPYCHYEDPRTPGGIEIEWDVSATGQRWLCELLDENLKALISTRASLVTSKEVGLEGHTEERSVCLCLVNRMQDKITI